MLLSQGQASRWTRPFALCLPIRLTFCPIPTSPPWVQIGCPVSGQAEPRQPLLRPDPGPPADLPFSQSPLAKKLHTAEPDSGGEERREEAASPEAAFTPSARPPNLPKAGTREPLSPAFGCWPPEPASKPQYQSPSTPKQKPWRGPAQGLRRPVCFSLIHLLLPQSGKWAGSHHPIFLES